MENQQPNQEAPDHVLVVDDDAEIRTLLAELPPRTPVLATTATANARVSADVAEQLAVGGHEVFTLRGALARDSLRLGVLELGSSARRLAWLVEHLGSLPGSGIVYCLTVANAEDTAAALAAAGHRVLPYTGRTDLPERVAAEQALLANEVKALVATSALGMGFDKPDLGFVVHLGAPSSPVTYYQQVGRAGRGVERAEVVLLPGDEDRAIWEWFGSQGFPPEDQVRTVLAGLDKQRESGAGPMSTAVLETVTSLRRTRLESTLKVLDVDGAVQRVRGGWESTGRPWSYDARRYARVDAARRAEQEAMVAYEGLGDDPGPEQGAVPCRMAFLRSALDDPLLEPGWRCGACDLCGGLELPEALDQEQVGAARQALGRAGVELRARRQWPTGMDRLGLGHLKGRIRADRQAATGLAVGRLDGFFEFNLKPWDVAAGALIVKEAGGIVTDMQGNDTWLQTGNIVAGNPKVLAQMLQIIGVHN